MENIENDFLTEDLLKPLGKSKKLKPKCIKNRKNNIKLSTGLYTELSTKHVDNLKGKHGR